MFSPVHINTQFEILGLFITRTLFVLLSDHSDCKKAGTFSCVSMIKLFSSTVLIVASIDFLKTNIINEQLYCIRQCTLCVGQTGEKEPQASWFTSLRRLLVWTRRLYCSFCSSNLRSSTNSQDKLSCQGERIVFHIFSNFRLSYDKIWNFYQSTKVFCVS